MTNKSKRIIIKRKKNLKEFNYQDYLNYQELKIEEKRGILELHDVGEKYEVHQPHDKIFKRGRNRKI